MNSASNSRRSCCCSFYFGIRMASVILLSLELTIGIIGITWLLIELLLLSLKDGDQTSAIDKENIPVAIFIFIVGLIAQVSIIIGLVGIKKKKPSMLVPYFICKCIIVVGAVWELFISWLIFALSLTNTADLLPLSVILKILFLMWNISSFTVFQMYNMELQEDLNRGWTTIHRPIQTAGAQPYTFLLNDL